MDSLVPPPPPFFFFGGFFFFPPPPAFYPTKSNVGFRMLQRMGWAKGKGLGKNNQGQGFVETNQRLPTVALAFF